MQPLSRWVGVVMVCVLCWATPRVNAAELYPVGASMRYTSTYKGAHTHAHTHVHSASCSHAHAHSHAHTAYAQAPTTTMRSTSSHMGTIATTSSAQVHTIGTGSGGYAGIASASSNSSNRGINYRGASASIAYAGGGFRTSAVSLSGGVTSNDTYASMSAPPMRKSVSGGVPWVPEGSCTECHWVWHEELGYYVCSVCGSTSLDGCDHLHEEGYCWCPLECGWDVWMFMAVLVAAYAVYKNKSAKGIALRDK